MPKFFVDEIDGTEVSITGMDARHISLSLRMQVGEALTLSAYGVDYACQILSLTPKEVRVKVLSSMPCTAEPSIELTLYQAIPKSDKLVTIIQKVIELGAVRIVPVLTQRCISRPSTEDFDRKLSRLQKIAKSAAKQSGRGIIPQVDRLHTITDMCTELEKAERSFLLYEGGGKRFSALELDECRQISLVVGSEGGFTSGEVWQIERAGAVSVWLGERILRCETAPLAAVSVVMYKTGNL